MIKLNRPSCHNPTALAGNYKHPYNKLALQNASYGKCMYCESKVLHTYYGDVEHIKPKDTYPQLEFEWDNLGFVCAQCNGKKSNKYDENTPYLNPYQEDPADYVIAVGALVKHKKGCERAEITIIDIDLNRASLIEKRQARIDDIEKAINSCFRTKNPTLKQNALAELKKEAEAEKEYAMIINALLKIHQII